MHIITPNKHLWFCLLFIVLEQLMVALSTWQVTLISEALMEGHDIVGGVLLFVVLLAGAYFPSVGIHVQLEQATYDLYDAALHHVGIANYNAPGAYFSRAVRDKREPYLVNELWSTIQDDLGYGVDALELLLGVLFNGTVIAQALDARFAAAYGLGFLIALVVMLLSRPTVAACTVSSQERQAALFQRVRTAVPNIWLGNRLAFDTWRGHFEAALSGSRSSQVHLVLFRDLLTSLTIVLYCLPFGVALVWFVRDNLTNAAMLATLVATLSRQVNILQDVSVLVAYIIQFQEKRSRTRLVAERLLLTPRELRSRGTIRWNLISLSPAGDPTDAHALRSLEDVMEITHGLGSGRWTVRGPNGAGKSSLLALLKRERGDEAFLLPADSVLDIGGLDGRESSTGQAKDASLQAAEREVAAGKVRLLLLDEWNANLDTTLQRKHADILRRVSEHACVIEVLHGHELPRGRPETSSVPPSI